MVLSGASLAPSSAIQGIAAAFDPVPLPAVLHAGLVHEAQLFGQGDPAGQAGDQFGISTSVSGNTAVVGSFLDDHAGGVDAGSAYVFVRTGTTWSLQAKLFAADAAAGDEFGISVSVSGDTVVVGAHRDDTGAGADAGSAYVFVRSGTTWTQQQKLAPPDAGAGDRFGGSVSLSGNTAVVGARLDDTGANTDSGSAYVFLRSGTTWSQQQKLLASDAAAGDLFGAAVSLGTDTVVVGSPFGNNGAGQDAGAAYVFLRSGTTWAQQQKLTAADAELSDNFGSSVSLSGNTAVVGAPFDNTAGGVDAGSTYVFVRSGITWSQQQKLTASDGSPGDVFGSSVSVFGNTAVVGAPSASSPIPDTGAVYAFLRSGAAWAQHQKLLAPDGSSGDEFGRAVFLSGSTAAFGAPLDDTAVPPGGGGVDAGSAHIFFETLTDLGVTKTDGQTTAVPGLPLTYTITVSNAGPSPAASATVTDTLPTALLGATWTCSGSAGSSCPASGTGNIFGPVNIAVAGTVTFVVSGIVAPGATGTLSNTVTATPSPIASDPNTANNSASDTDVLTPQADLTITKTDGQATVAPGSPLTYTIVASNPGPSNAPGAVVTDVFPAALTGVVWTCAGTGGATCTASGGGSINDTVSLPAGATATYTATGTVAPSATGTISNTATVTPPGGVPDPNTANNSATDVDTLAPEADLAITKTDGQATAVPGLPLTYTIVVSNGGPSHAPGAVVTDVFPAPLAGVVWTCAGTGGATCTAGGAGNINDTVNLPAGDAVTYTATGTVPASATGTLSNTATVAAPAGVPDPNPANNSATDVDTLAPQADLGISKTDSADPVAPGDPLSYVLTINNAGPSVETSVTVVDVLPVGVTLLSSIPPAPTCTLAGSTLTCNLGAMVVGGTVTVFVNGTVGIGATGILVNTATVSGSAMDPDPRDNTDTAATAVGPRDGELAHGTNEVHDLAALPGPVADEDVFRIAQKPYSSYEVVIDATSGDIGAGNGPVLERLAPDGNILQSSAPVGTGPSRSLRWTNDLPFEVEGETIRVRSGGCSTDCGADDVYRIRAYETTYSIARFNNTGSQVTVLILQNATTDIMGGVAYLRNLSGSVVCSVVFGVTGHRTVVIDTTTCPGANGISGSITVANSSRYGAISGKAVSLEPSTGFSFDSPLVPRAR